MHFKSGIFALIGALCSMSAYADTIRVATFNVSMDGSNYAQDVAALDESPLPELLAKGENEQIQNIAAIIQRVRPDVILLNEFDYDENWQRNAALFQQNYLGKPQLGGEAIEFKYAFSAPVNTGQVSAYDYDGDGVKGQLPADGYGFGFYPGHYGMLVLSNIPIDTANIRTFKNVKWSQQPDAVIPKIDGEPFYDEQTWTNARLSSKSFWDVPLKLGGNTVHLLASHPTPPVFDGPEDRNGLRNKAEIQLLIDYINNSAAPYLKDDQGLQGGLADSKPFVIVGDLNAAPEGDKARPDVIKPLLEHPRVNSAKVPRSEGGAALEKVPFSQYYTAAWRARVDYALPSTEFTIEDSGVFWPQEGEPLADVVSARKRSSDHKLVWIDIKLKKH